MIELKYGKTKIELNTEATGLRAVLKGKHFPFLDNPVNELKAAFGSPIESKPLGKKVHASEEVLIIVSDKTRSTAAEFILPLLLDELNAAGVPDKNITLLFALGMHPKQSREEQTRIVGTEVAGRVKLVDHDCHDPKTLKKISLTSRGTPVIFNRLVTQADKVILTGGITYHYYAGFTGGRKSLMPGAASFESIQANHSLVMDQKKGGAHPKARTGILIGNPVHEDMVEAASSIDPAFLINVVLNEAGRLAGIFAGNWVDAHEAGCRFVDAHCRVTVDELADCVIVSAGGHPEDINFVQAHKAMDNAAFALKQGGVMIALAECAEGLPSPEYLKWFALGSSHTIEDKLKEKYSVPGHTVHAALEKAERFQIILVSRLNPKDVKQMKMTPATSLEEALKLAQETLGSNFSTYVIPEGLMTLPQLVNP